MSVAKSFSLSEIIFIREMQSEVNSIRIFTDYTEKTHLYMSVSCKTQLFGLIIPETKFKNIECTY